MILEKFLRWFFIWDEKPKEYTSQPSNDRWNDHFTKEEFEENQKEFFDAMKGKREEITAVLRDPKLAVDKIQEYQGESVRKFEFRPQTWEQFIGQTEAKERAKTIIKKTKKGLKAHFLVDGIKGHGKTTYVELLAKDLNAHIIKRVGKQIDEESLVDIINEINTSPHKTIVFFVDEIDSMDWKIIKILNPIIESFEIAGKRIKPFIFAGATINKHVLIKNNPDTLDRIPTHIKFVRYNDSEIQTILKQYADQLYGNENITEEVLIKISRNCKFNPRTSIGLLEEYIVEECVDKVLKNCHIVVEGLTALDIKLLTILNGTKRSMGANALAMKAGLSQNEYIREFEPFLCEFGYLNRIPSRVISNKGKQILERITNEGLL